MKSKITSLEACAIDSAYDYLSSRAGRRNVADSIVWTLGFDLQNRSSVRLSSTGLPLPSIPVVLAASALSSIGEMNFSLVVLITVLASVPADVAWFYLGRMRGGKVLNLLCSISLEPDFCVYRTEASFERFGSYTLVVAKFVPGLATIAPSMAGLAGMSTT